jgi:hypothetical protein
LRFTQVYEKRLICRLFADGVWFWLGEITRGVAMDHTEQKPLAYSSRTISEFATGAKPMAARQARDIERRLGLPPGWLDAKGDRQCTPIFST